MTKNRAMNSPQFFGIEIGQELSFPGMRIKALETGHRIYMHGKWFDLGGDHAIMVFSGTARFKRADGTILQMAQFPAWVIKSEEKKPTIAMMFNSEQFRGGKITVIDRAGKKITYSVN